MGRGLMANFLLLHGAASTGWLWHRVVAELEQAGHATVAPDLPCADTTADLYTYIDVACTAAEKFGQAPLTVVAQSLSGLMVPALAARLLVARIVLVAAMIPRPNETGVEWWDATGQAETQRVYLESLGLSAHDAQDPEVVFIHDFDDALKAESIYHVPEQHSGPLETPVMFESWPIVPTHVVAAEGDRLFPLEFMRQQTMDRLGIEPDVISGGHLAPLTQPRALGQLLLQYES